jgi:hypothetical protein
MSGVKSLSSTSEIISNSSVLCSYLSVLIYFSIFGYTTCFPTVSNSRVRCRGKTGERLFIQSSRPVSPGIRIREPKSNSGRCLSAGIVPRTPAASRRPADPWIPPESMWPAQNLAAAPRDLPAAFVAILAMRTWRLERKVRTACSSARRESGTIRL